MLVFHAKVILEAVYDVEILSHRQEDLFLTSEHHEAFAFKTFFFP